MPHTALIRATNGDSEKCRDLLGVPLPATDSSTVVSKFPCKFLGASFTRTPQRTSHVESSQVISQWSNWPARSPGLLVRWVSPQTLHPGFH